MTATNLENLERSLNAVGNTFADRITASMDAVASRLDEVSQKLGDTEEALGAIVGGGDDGWNDLPLDYTSHLMLDVPYAGFEFSLLMSAEFFSISVPVDWGDGTTETITEEGLVSHTYQAKGRYHVTVTDQNGDSLQFNMNNNYIAQKSRTALSRIAVYKWSRSYPSNAYMNCPNLTDVTLSKGGSGILGPFLFSNCVNLRNVMFAEGVKSIGDGTFQGCYNLRSLTFPASLVSFGSNPFNGCMLLTVRFLSANPPTSPYVLFNTASDISHLRIIVPRGSLSAYQNATNLSQYADIMEEAQ